MIKLMVDYFPVKLVKTADLDPGRNYLLGNHPHGVICFGAIFSIATGMAGRDELFPGIEFRLMSLREFYLIPALREMALMGG